MGECVAFYSPLCVCISGLFIFYFNCIHIESVRFDHFHSGSAQSNKGLVGSSFEFEW